MERDSNKMRCPRCGAILKENGQERYVDTSEHVSCCENNPDWDPGLRDVWRCKQCELPGFFDWYGSYYSGMVGIPQKYWGALDSYEMDAFRKIHKDRLDDIAMVNTLPDNIRGPWKEENEDWAKHYQELKERVQKDFREREETIIPK